MRDSEATVELIQLSSYHKSDMIGLGSERIAIYPDWSEAEVAVHSTRRLG